MNLVAIIQTGASLDKFVKKDLLHHLVEIQFDAAAEVLSNVEYANDKKSVYWSCINHLEDAEAMCRSKINTGERDEACRRYYYISALKAIIYKSLDEDRLVTKCCDDCLALEAMRVKNDKGVVDAYNPRFMFSLLKTIFTKNELLVNARRFNPSAFWKALLKRDTHFGLPVWSNEQEHVDPSDAEWESSF